MHWVYVEYFSIALECFERGSAYEVARGLNNFIIGTAVAVHRGG